MARFSYTPYSSDPTPADPTPGYWLPKIEVAFRGDLDEIGLNCLVDTGAVETVLPAEFKEQLGARPAGPAGELTVGNGEKMEVTYGALELSIRLDGVRYRWRAVVAFGKDRDGPVLGDAGFFRYFNVSFCRRDRYLLVYRPVELPPAGLG